VIAEDHFWCAVCDALALDDLRDVDYAQRLGRVEELNARVARALAQHTGADALAALERVGAPVAPALTPEAAQQPDGFPARLAHHRPRARERAPALDEHHAQPWPD
jgi:crotonobetainyl-CoA:carnitine CoA-transferase CaiB-like acyl-CoA transferase